jgi:hypothetical protein
MANGSSTPSFADMAISATGRCNIVIRPEVRGMPAVMMGDRAAVILLRRRKSPK